MPATAERPPAAPAACPHCGADVEPDQLFCLTCGERIALGYRRPASWRFPAAVMAVVVALAGAAVAIALVQIAGDAEEVAGPPVQPPAAAQQGTDTTPERTDTSEEEATPAPEQAEGGIRSWPEGTSAYTVILLSTTTVEGARQVARQAAQAGIPAGVLHSSDYSSLNPGYQVVFAGEFDTAEEAQAEAERYAGLGFPGGYARFVNGDE